MSERPSCICRKGVGHDPWCPVHGDDGEQLELAGYPLEEVLDDEPAESRSGPGELPDGY